MHRCWLRIMLASSMAPQAFGFPVSAETPVETYTLTEALHKATLNNAVLQSAEQDITIAKQRVKEARYLFYPEIGLAGSATRYDARYPFALRPGFGSLLLFPSAKDNLISGQGYMTLSLYEGRRHINTLRLAQTALKQARSKYETGKLEIVYETKKAFYHLILAQESLSATQELLAEVRRTSERAKMSAWERVEAEALSSELRAAAAEAGHRLELARLEFLKGLNRELDTPVRVEGSLESQPADVDLQKALVWATELRPELQAQTYRAQMDAISVNLALGRRTPKVLLGLDYEVTGQEFPLTQNNWDATIGVRLPFSFDFWTQHRQRIAEQRQGEIQRAELRDQVHLEVRKAHQDLLYWRDEWPRREAEHLRLKELRDKALSESGPSVAALRASARLLETHMRALEALTEHILARARLERAVGRPLPNPS
ncbi:MAG: TolC family protein [Elusimicrobiota bacterium]